MRLFEAICLSKNKILKELFEHRVLVVEVEGKADRFVPLVQPVQHPVTTSLCIGHEEGVVLKGDMAALHAYLAVDRLEIDGLDVVDLEADVVDVGQLPAFGIDLPVIRVAGEDRRARRRRLVHDPSP